MYKAVRIQGHGLRVVYLEEGKCPIIADGRKQPFSTKSNANRAAKRLNEALEEINAMIAQTGAIIL